MIELYCKVDLIRQKMDGAKRLLLWEYYLVSKLLFISSS